MEPVNESTAALERPLHIEELLAKETLLRSAVMLFFCFLGITFVYRYLTMGNGFIGIIDLFFGIVGIVSAAAIGQPLIHDMLCWRVKIIEGRAQVHLNGRQAKLYVTSIFNDSRRIFNVSEKIAEKIEEGHCYHIEYLPNTRIILEIHEC